jgi:hypothetical protein
VLGIQQRKREAAADSPSPSWKHPFGSSPIHDKLSPCKDAMDVFWDLLDAAYSPARQVRPRTTTTAATARTPRTAERTSPPPPSGTRKELA